MSIPATYFPPGESAGGWRRCLTDIEVRDHAGMDPKRLKLIAQTQSQLYGGPWAIAIIKSGHLAGEWFGTLSLPNTTFDIWSCTKSMTSLAFGLLFEDSRAGVLENNQTIDLESAAYDFLPEGFPLSDERKRAIRIKHLLSMTSGIPGESLGLLGIPIAPGGGEFEFALGHASGSFNGSAARMLAAPGEMWDYSDAAFAHLSLIFSRVAGKEIHSSMQERLFTPIGVGSVGWDLRGGAGHIGPHTSPGFGLHMSARDLARVGYLMAHRGKWEGKQILPEWWIDASTQSSQELNRSYGYGIWVNTDGVQWPDAPRDAFALQGYGANRCYVVPSLDLVVVRLGYGPPNWGEGSLLPAVLRAIG
jgi:CubicO group peptidase (beta-lactamase class C family)